MPNDDPKGAKERLLAAAAKVFACHGFDRASTRQVVQEAGVNISAIPYYFGGKEGLYSSIIEQIVSMVLAEQGQKAAEIRGAINEGTLTREQGQKLLHEFIEGFADFLLNKASPHMAQIMIREQMQPTAVFEVLYSQLMEPMHKTMTDLVAFLTGLEPESEEAILCTHTLFGQVAVFRTHQEFILRRTKLKSYDQATSKRIIALLVQNTDAIIAAHTKG